MQVREYYAGAIEEGYYGLELVIEYLVFEQKVLSLEDDGEKLDYYLQEKFHKAMNKRLIEYERKRGKKIS
ncbi:hypothetical protein LC087_19105 (plasmid) [Bacillus carboniphilus]|uniref:Uncharacterized protein n=1 Tax=Bacillus carboniphilus TaxID=86663 RepID=A0ABY9K0P9_9BACI|nr:hypothetical protein [Bacillus carboniphilus]WLR44417.1 hypothetical protein LC087_19105 [Bacillus carboniphilus]